MAKSADAFRTISEVAEWLDLPTHVLRFWESKFSQVKPVKRAGGRRYYRPADMLLLGGIKKLLHDDGMTIKGAQKTLREHGVKHVSALSQPLDGETLIEAEAAPEPPSIEAEEAQASAEVVPLYAPETEAEPPAEPEPAEAAGPTAETPAASEAQTAEEASEPPASNALQARVPSEDPSETAAPSSGLPSFLQKPLEFDETEAPEAEAPAAARAENPALPPDPSDTEADIDAGILSRLAAHKAPLPEAAEKTLREARAALLALADR